MIDKILITLVIIAALFAGAAVHHTLGLYVPPGPVKPTVPYTFAEFRASRG